MTLFNPGTWTATKRVLIGGTTYSRGQAVATSALMAERKRDVLINKRYVVPQHDLHLRKTDRGGFGQSPRCHPTPAFHSARLMRDLPVWPVGPRDFAIIPVTKATGTKASGSKATEPVSDEQAVAPEAAPQPKRRKKASA